MILGHRQSRLIKAGHDDWLGLRLDSGQFCVEVLKPATVVGSNFHHEADRAIGFLADRYCDRPLYLPLSGGLDSEFVANLLLKNSIPFRPIILKIDSFNSLESWYAEYWCKKHDIDPIRLNLTTDQYIQEMKKYYQYLLKLQNHSQTPMMYLYDYVDKINGYCIYSAGDINLDFKEKKFYCYSLDFISDLLNNGHPTSFFMYTPELALSYISEFDVNITEQENKLNFYNVSPRPKIDYISSLYSCPSIAEVIDNFWHISNQQIASYPYWYGKKEQLIKKLVGSN